jgi:hypothetical protein
MADGGWRKAVGGLLFLRPHNPLLKCGREDDMDSPNLEVPVGEPTAPGSQVGPRRTA